MAMAANRGPDIFEMDIRQAVSRLGTNALLERKGARIGVITTQGLRDVLEMRRRDRPTTWGLKGSFTPVVERPDRVEVSERVLAEQTLEQRVTQRRSPDLLYLPALPLNDRAVFDRDQSEQLQQGQVMQAGPISEALFHLRVTHNLDPVCRDLFKKIGPVADAADIDQLVIV